MSEKRFINSRDNYFQHAEVLKSNRKKRFKYQEFLVEGVKLIDSIIAHKWQLTGVYYTDSGQEKKSSWATNIIEQCTCDHYVLAPNLMQELSDKEDTSEIICTARMRPDEIGSIATPEKFLITIFDRPSSPGNLGSSIRSCDAFGTNGIIVTGHSADIYDPVTVRSSLGTLFSQTVIRMPAFQDISDWIRRFRQTHPNLVVVGTSAKATEPLFDFKSLSRPIIILAGNETYGLSANLLSLCDTVLSIPMNGWASSLNVSCALSIALYQVSSTRT